MEKIVRFYVKGIFIAEAINLSFSLLVHVCLGMGYRKLDEECGQYLIAAAVLMCGCAFVIAKDRNIMENEFNRCPWWIQALAFVSAIYGGSLTVSHMMHSAGQGGSGDRFRSSAMPLLIDSLPLCILYAAVWKDTAQDELLIRRGKLSIVVLIVGVAILITKWNTYFPHPAN